MSMKSWVLHQVQGVAAATGRADLGGREASSDRHDDALSGDDPRAGEAEPAGASLDDLGVYAPLVGAVRDELEHFVASQVRLHVVIADHDRFVLTAIGVRSPGGPHARELLQKFMREFRPEQIKRYLAREVIGRLPNAAVIELSQFSGLADLQARERDDEDPYGELVAALQTTPEAPARQPYEVSVLGRWIESEAVRSLPRRASAGEAAPSTPLAGRHVEFEITDADGTRRVMLHSVVAGRRYVIGKGDDCDLRVNGIYTSRRHAELWFDAGAWYVADAGSTNGLRMQQIDAAGIDPRQTQTAPPGGSQTIRLQPRMRLVLSARAEGPAGEYPWIAMGPGRSAAVAATPIAAAPHDAGDLAGRAAPMTPRTAVVTARSTEPVFEMTESRAAGSRAHALRRSELPITVGRSRGQTVVIDWSFAGVSGHHLDIDAIDDEAAHGTVHGDNGVYIGGVHHAAGSAFDWPLGQEAILGGALPGEPACVLSLDRQKER